MDEIIRKRKIRRKIDELINKINKMETYGIEHINNCDDSIEYRWKRRTKLIDFIYNGTELSLYYFIKYMYNIRYGRYELWKARAFDFELEIKNLFKLGTVVKYSLMDKVIQIIYDNEIKFDTNKLINQYSTDYKEAYNFKRDDVLEDVKKYGYDFHEELFDLESFNYLEHVYSTGQMYYIDSNLLTILIEKGNEKTYTDLLIDELDSIIKPENCS